MESVNVFFIAFCWIKMESVNVFFIVFYMNDFCGCFLRVCIYEWNLLMFSQLIALLNEIDDVFFIVTASVA